ncbi:MAG: hypothetical protein H6587_01700 [Flavobacteriales bacterium]|nr:hypothetical protein [Flavobacteriales bacterium]MCB9363259.1 hypothetical protein [Flavobacteriales bacterium]
MKYLIVSKELLDFSLFSSEITKFFIEINSEGNVVREVGLDKNGVVVHKYPSERFKYGGYGIMDLSNFDLDFQDDLTSEEFENLWNGYVR